jgi:hypothetical protein
MMVKIRSVMPVLALAVVVGCGEDFPFEPPPYQVEPPPEYTGPIAHTFTYLPHEEGPEIESIVVRGTFNGWSGNAMRMTLNAFGEWSVTASLEQGTHDYKYVFNGENWADNMCASDTWGNPPGGRIDPSVEECRGGGDGVLVVTADGPIAHTFTYVPHEETPEIESIVVRGTFNGWSGNAMAMTEHEGTWSVVAGLEPGEHDYKYVFNGENWADNMCASDTWGNPPGGRIDPDVEECRGGGDGVLVIGG